MSIIAEIRTSLAGEWLPNIYKDKIRTQRTRALTLEIPERENSVEIQYTLLGIEIKIGRRRVACPDLATARYMRVFARLGCREFAVPYDITTISPLADELETAWQRTLLHINSATRNKTERSGSQARSQVIKLIRIEIAEIGPGETMPKFDRPTQQRTS